MKTRRGIASYPCGYPAEGHFKEKGQVKQPHAGMSVACVKNSEELGVAGGRLRTGEEQDRPEVCWGWGDSGGRLGLLFTAGFSMYLCILKYIRYTNNIMIWHTYT